MDPMKVPEMPEADPDRNWANMFQTLRSVRIKKLEIWAKTLRSSDRIETWPGAGGMTRLRIEFRHAGVSRSKQARYAETVHLRNKCIELLLYVTSN